MGDGQRLAALELVLEDRHDAAVRAEDVAEPDRRRTAGRCAAAASATSISATRLLAPMTLDGLTALSVDTRTKRSHAGFDGRVAGAAMRAAMLTWTASEGCSSIIGTCL